MPGDVFIAHLPAGYLVSRIVDRTRSRAVLAASLLGSVLPDVDMLWFHLVDHGRVHHHRYWTHVPLFWLALAVPTLLVVRALAPRWLAAVIAFFVGLASHLVLETVVGDIQWIQPFSDRFVHLFTVERRGEGHWFWAFLLHWTFALELVLVALAVGVAWSGRSSRRSALRLPSHLL